MDAKNEVAMLDLLKSISESLKDIKSEIAEVAVAVRESNSFDLDDECDCDENCEGCKNG